MTFIARSVYDDPAFFERYSRFRRSREGLAGAPEWPVLKAMLPSLSDLRVVDLGCGFGAFCRWAGEQGAAAVLGLDSSEKMLARARAETGDPRISYRRAAMEDVEFPAASADLVFSSLAFHYVADFAQVCANVHRGLRHGGHFVFSVEHPVFTAPRTPEWIAAEGRPAWPLNGYLDEGPRSTDRLTAGVLKQHRTLAGYVNPLLAHGFRLSRLEEWGPSTEQLQDRPDLAGDRERPPFLLISARTESLTL